ncbi:hypothetical protein [Longitalea luteola]|uniref:hypothetical protein n=1 Tax=Longitalea luteola TaxID=2812563 RepID=UPI001A97C644|nr:hypothetical protein [Longitalea luteola]
MNSKNRYLATGTLYLATGNRYPATGNRYPATGNFFFKPLVHQERIPCLSRYSHPL